MRLLFRASRKKPVGYIFPPNKQENSRDKKFLRSHPGQGRFVCHKRMRDGPGHKFQIMRRARTAARQREPSSQRSDILPQNYHLRHRAALL